MAAGDEHPNGGLDADPGHGTQERLRDGGSDDPPSDPVSVLVWFGITKSAWCGPYCAATIVAMLVLMRYRRSTYSMAM
jgi:hypothetical protein